MLCREVNDEDEVGKEIEVNHDNVWVKAKIVEFVDNTSHKTTAM